MILESIKLCRLLIIFLLPENMTVIRYSYQTIIDFSDKIHDHIFTLRCQPEINTFQKVIESSLLIHPEAKFDYEMDYFGNNLISGNINKPHKYFRFLSEGLISLSEYYIPETLQRLYLYPSSLTKSNEDIRKLTSAFHFTKHHTTLEKVCIMSDYIHKKMQYIPGTTNTLTTAADALKNGSGVCQDYAHLLICFCRMAGIAARYVTGFIPGEGYTHAWVEYYNQTGWYAYDPTHNLAVKSNYIKVAHGRDFNDCPIERGVFRGYATQSLSVQLKVSILEA